MSYRTHRRALLFGATAAAALPFLRAGPSALRPSSEHPVHPRRAPVPDAGPFLDAVRSGDLARVQALLDARPELLGTIDESGCSALVVALLAGFAPVAELLIQRGHEPDLVEAAMLADWPRFAALAEAAPELVDAHHPVGGTALYGAARVGSEGLWRIQAAGGEADGKPLGWRGSTPSAGALSCPDPVAAWCTLIDLLGNGASVHARQPGGATLLHRAAKRGDVRLIETLLEFGAEPAARDDQGRTARELAEQCGQAAAAARLAAPGDIARVHGRLRYAFDASGGPVELEPLWDVPPERQGRITGDSHNKLEAVRAALAADPRLWRCFSSQQELAIEACAHTGNREIVRLHLDHGAPQSVATSITLGDLERARALLDFDPLAVHERGPHHFALAWYPAIGGAGAAAMELLLERGLPVDQHSKGTSGLHWAARAGDLELIRLLLERGADPRQVGHQFERRGQTPREVALAFDQGAAVALLGEHGG